MARFRRRMSASSVLAASAISSSERMEPVIFSSRPRLAVRPRKRGSRHSGERWPPPEAPGCSMRPPYRPAGGRPPPASPRQSRAPPAGTPVPRRPRSRPKPVPRRRDRSWAAASKPGPSPPGSPPRPPAAPAPGAAPAWRWIFQISQSWSLPLQRVTGGFIIHQTGGKRQSPYRWGRRGANTPIIIHRRSR